jgi:hypothetical protein
MSADAQSTLAGVAEAVLAASPFVRYVAVSVDGALVTRVAAGRSNASAGESDWYEETLVNPTILGLAARRGAMGCGGLDYVLVRYGHFFQLLVPVTDGHVSACIEPDASPIGLIPAVFEAARPIGAAIRPWQAPDAGGRLAAEPFMAGDLPTTEDRRMLAALYGVSDEVRYVALRSPGRLLLTSRVGDPASGDDRSDRYEELLVNPTLLAIARARSEIDCGGLRYLAVGYPAFFALVLPTGDGHATVSLPRGADPAAVAPAFEALLAGLSRG